MIQFGPDISHWEPRVDFAALKSAGALGVFLKATQGSMWVDPTFVSRVSLANSVGLLVGAYHFCDASDPMAQVNHFLLVASAATEVLAFDVEPNESTGGTVSIPQVAEMVSRTQAMTGRLPVLYINRYGPSGTGAGLPNTILARCPLWVWDISHPYPWLPSGWQTWTFWQYSQQGVDMNRFNGTQDELTAFWNGK